MEVGPHELALGLHLKIVRSTVTWVRVVMVRVRKRDKIRGKNIFFIC